MRLLEFCKLRFKFYKAKGVKLMKKFISFLVCLIICLSFVACGSKNIEVKYYMDTNVPTFTCITGIEKSEIKEDTPITGVDTYVYKGCSESDYNDYVYYLKNELGFTELEANDDYPFISVELDEQNAIIDYSGLDEGVVRVTPYIN
jgi:hypothetical protein